uniref:Reverse transcriptase domain-containing protein n=1 Tax=Homalodisca liturata TaxID=320908 RepID=A0A1B6IN72_9HEMI
MVQFVKSSPKEITRGVPQGSVLGPILFILFTNDMPQQLGDLSTCLMFADDTTLIISGDTTANLKERSAQSLHKAYKYCKDNDLVANTTKTKQICFWRSNAETVGLENIVLEDKVKLLGMTIDRKLTWTPHVDNLCKTLSSGLYAMRRLKQVADINTARTAYFGLCEPHIRYGLIVWGGTSHGNMERVLILQKRAIRILADLQPLETCRNSFKDLKIKTVVNLYIQEAIMYADKHEPLRNDKIHNYNTRHASFFVTPQHRLTLYERQPLYIGCKLHNHLPDNIRGLKGQDLRRELSRWLTDRPFYSLAEFLKPNN